MARFSSATDIYRGYSPRFYNYLWHHHSRYLSKWLVFDVLSGSSREATGFVVEIRS